MISTKSFLIRKAKARTREAYGIALKQYFDFLNTIAEVYNPTEDQLEVDIAEFTEHLRKRKLAPKSVTLKVKAIISYLRRNKIILDEDFIKGLSLSDEAETDDRIPTQEELQSIFTHLDVKGRAIYFTMLSTGLRIGDVMDLTIEDISNGDKLKVKQNKTGRKLTVFLTHECRDAINEWLKIREEWLIKTVKRCKYRGIDKISDDNRLFPLTVVNAHKLWTNALKRAGLEVIDKTGIRTIRPHSLRKYFRTACAIIGIQQDIAEALIGHSKGLNRIYVTKYLTEEKLEQAFRRLEPQLSVYTTIIREENTDELKKQMESMAERIKELEKILAHRPLRI